MSVSAYTLGIVRGSGFVSCLELKIRIKSFSCITKKIYIYSTETVYCANAVFTQALSVGLQGCSAEE